MINLLYSSILQRNPSSRLGGIREDTAPKKYNVDKLIYFEKFELVNLAITREKQIKGYSRLKKNALIDQFNPGWKELFVNGQIENPK